MCCLPTCCVQLHRSWHNIYKCLEDDLSSKVLKFADDTTVFRKVTNVTDKQSLQDDLDKLVKLSEKWQMLLHFGKCKCIHIGHGNMDEEYKMGDAVLGRTAQENMIWHWLIGVYYPDYRVSPFVRIRKSSAVPRNEDDVRQRLEVRFVGLGSCISFTAASLRRRSDSKKTLVVARWVARRQSVRSVVMDP